MLLNPVPCTINLHINVILILCIPRSVFKPRPLYGSVFDEIEQAHNCAGKYVQTPDLSLTVGVMESWRDCNHFLLLSPPSLVSGELISELRLLSAVFR